MKTQDGRFDSSVSRCSPFSSAFRKRPRRNLSLAAAVIVAGTLALIVFLGQPLGLAQAPPAGAEAGTDLGGMYGLGGSSYGGEGDFYGAEMGEGGMGAGMGSMGYGMGSTMPGQDAHHELQVRLNPVLNRLRDAKDDKQKDAIKGELSKILDSYFEQDMQWRSSEIESIEQRVQRLRNQLQRRRQAKEEILQLQLKVLENEAAGLGFFGRRSGSGGAGSYGLGGTGYPGGGPGGMDEYGGYPGAGAGMGYGMARAVSPVPQAFSKRTALTFTESPLSDVIDFLRNCCQANIYVDQAALKEARLTLDRPVTVSLIDVSVATALELVADFLSGSLGVRYEDGIAIVGSRTAPPLAEQFQWGSDGTRASMQTESRLANTGNYEFIDTPLTDAIVYLEDMAEVDAFIHVRTLAEAGVSDDTPVSLRLKNVKHRTALRLILDSVSKSLYFSVVDGVVVVSANKPASTKKFADPFAAEPPADETAPAAPPRAETNAYLPPVSGAEEVAVLEVQLRAAKAKLDVLDAGYEKGETSLLELQEAKSTVEIAEQKLSKAQREYAGREQLLKLALQQAQLNMDAAAAMLEENKAINERSPGAIPQTQLKQYELSVRQAETAVERAQTLLELHCKQAD
jgi:hypothetical protein